MKTRTFFILSLLLLCVSCNLEQKQQLSYVEGNWGHEYRIHKIRIPENWKIVDAQLDFRKMHLEFDRGKGIEKQTLEYPYRNMDIIDDFYEGLKFIGSNRFDGLTHLHFSIEEDPLSEFNPPIGSTKISSGIKEREEFAIFRSSKWLVINYSIKNTFLGNLTFHDVTKRYANNQINDGNIASFETIDGKMHYNIVFNNRVNRSFLIDKYYGQHETYNSSGQSQSKTNDKLIWTWGYRIDSNPIVDK